MTDLERAIAAGGQPAETDLDRARAAGGAAVPEPPPSSPAAAPAPPAKPSLLSRVAHQVAQPFMDIGHGVMEANRFATRAILHPVDTFNQIRANPLATARETMRGVNDTIPFANTLVEHLPGGPPADSPADAAAAPAGVRAFSGLAAAPLTGDALGGIAAKTVETAAPVVANAVRSFGEGAEARNVARAKEALELKVNKGTRAGLRSDAVDTTLSENPKLRAAAGNDTKVAAVTAKVKAQAQETLAPIYAGAGPADEAAAKAVSNMDERIVELKKGNANERAAAKKLQNLRDEFNRTDPGKEWTAQALREEQSTYQKNGYAKNIMADPDVTATILAQREMSKAVGDALVEHVTGMDYEAAKAAAARDPKSTAARLFKANEQISAANKIEAGIADRAGRVQPPHGAAAVVKRIASHAILPAVVGASHGPTAGLIAAGAQEALHAAPAVARLGARTADRAIAATAPRVAGALDRAGEAAAGNGGIIQRLQAAADAGNPRAVKLLAGLRTAGATGAPPLGSATAGTLAPQ